MAVSGKVSSAIEFAETTMQRRAEVYRERAAQLLGLAEREPIPSVRAKLLALASEYEDLAAGIRSPQLSS